MNSTSTNTTCFFANINEVLNSADQGLLNITRTVQQCPNICALAWGNGNPDLSGIGAVISYIIQAILTLLLGPVFCILYGMREKLLRNKTQERLISLQDNFLDISASFSIPVAVAALVRLKQGAPFFEITFLKSLITMQFISLLLTAIVSAIVQHRENKMKRTMIVVLYLILELGLYVGFQGGLNMSEVSWTGIKELADACNGYGALKPGFAYIQSAKVLPHISAAQYFNPFSKEGEKFVGIIIGFILAGCLGLVITIGLLWLIIYVLIKHNPVILSIISSGLWIAVIFYTVELEKKRNIMQAVTGSDFSDNNQWGFGQVVALLLWGPLLVQALYTILMTCVSALRHERDIEYTSVQNCCANCANCINCGTSRQPHTTAQAARKSEERKDPDENQAEATIEDVNITTTKDVNTTDDVGKDKTEKHDADEITS